MGRRAGPAGPARGRAGGAARRTCKNPARGGTPVRRVARGLVYGARLRARLGARRMRDPRPVRHDRAPARPGAGPALAGPPATAASPAAAPADGTTGEPARTPAPRVARRPLPAGRERATALGVAGV